MADQDQETQDLLQSALASSFSPSSLPRTSLSSSPASQPTSVPPPVEPASPPSVPGTDAHDTWKEEYEAQVAQWRAANIEQRERAERERERWEKIREEEKLRRGRDGEVEVEGEAEGEAEGEGKASGWENVSEGKEKARDPDSPSPADVRDLVAGEREGHHEASGSHHPHHVKDPSSLSASQKWEDLPSSLNSSQSYPSLSFPSLSNPETPPDLGHPHASSSHPHHSHHHPQSHLHPHESHRAHGTGRPDSEHQVTFAIFDSSLPINTRVWALAGSFGINFVLPFVNGVMLGFGELFAKEVVFTWMGWGRGAGAEGARERDRLREMEARRRSR